MKVVWFGIAAAFVGLMLASSLHFLYIRRKLRGGVVRKVMGVPTGFVELYSLAKGMVFLEVVGFAIALIAAMIDAFS
jgi:uncharacterized membrane protein YdjX (TVP38/TMEM64 family)